MNSLENFEKSTVISLSHSTCTRTFTMNFYKA